MGQISLRVKAKPRDITGLVPVARCTNHHFLAYGAFSLGVK